MLSLSGRVNAQEETVTFQEKIRGHFWGWMLRP